MAVLFALAAAASRMLQRRGVAHNGRALFYLIASIPFLGGCPCLSHACHVVQCLAMVMWVTTLPARVACRLPAWRVRTFRCGPRAHQLLCCACRGGSALGVRALPCVGLPRSSHPAGTMRNAENCLRLQSHGCVGLQPGTVAGGPPWTRLSFWRPQHLTGCTRLAQVSRRAVLPCTPRFTSRS